MSDTLTLTNKGDKFVLLTSVSRFSLFNSMEYSYLHAQKVIG